ncbi:MAG: hypothetical protein ACREB8_14590 [Pseudolabrys sp.]
MLLRSEFGHYCELIGRMSAMIMLAGMASLLLAATLLDILR